MNANNEGGGEVPPDVIYKIILIGKERVGKTSITKQFVKGQFDEKEESSKVCSLYTKRIHIEDTDDTCAELQIWDTLGQEKFKSMGALFYKESHGAFIVFDLSNRQSFADLPSWVTTLTDVLGENVIIVLLGNCCDK